MHKAENFSALSPIGGGTARCIANRILEPGRRWSIDLAEETGPRTVPYKSGHHA